MLMVSALIPTEPVEVGVAAVARIPNVHLVVAGDGPLRETIATTAAELLPGRFTRVSVAPMKMPRLYRSADAFLHLSKDEPSSLAFLEAMACGLPVVAHESPQLRWIAGADEYLLDTDGTEAVSGQLEAALGRGSFDRERRRRKIEAFSWTSIAERYREFFREILKFPRRISEVAPPVRVEHGPFGIKEGRPTRETRVPGDGTACRRCHERPSPPPAERRSSEPASPTSLP